MTTPKNFQKFCEDCVYNGYVVYTDYNISVEMSISDLEKYKIIRRD